MPAKETVRKTEIPVIPGLGRSPRARNPGTQTSANVGMAGVHRFRAWSCGPSRNDEKESARQGHFLTASLRRGDEGTGNKGVVMGRLLFALLRGFLAACLLSLLLAGVASADPPIP